MEPTTEAEVTISELAVHAMTVLLITTMVCLLVVVMAQMFGYLVSISVIGLVFTLDQLASLLTTNQEGS